MRSSSLLFVLIAIAVAFCNYNKKERHKNNKNKLVESWRLGDYAEYDMIARTWVHSYGEHPKEYFTYTNTCIVNLNDCVKHSIYNGADSIYTKPVRFSGVSSTGGSAAAANVNTGIVTDVILFTHVPATSYFYCFIH